MSKLNISEFGTGRQAKNVLPHALADAVTPWFADVAGDKKVQRALAALTDELTRRDALNYLGLRVEDASADALAA